MIWYLNLMLRLTIWFLLTGDSSAFNIFLGIIIAILLPGSPRKFEPMREWFRAFINIIFAIPIAYWEALEMIIFPHRYEEVVLEKVSPGRTAGLVFLDIFLITFTPKAIVLKNHEDGWYEVHYLRRKLP